MSDASGQVDLAFERAWRTIDALLIRAVRRADFDLARTEMENVDLLVGW